MLNFGFFEIIVVIVLSLVVVGPERLPIVVRYLGRQYGKLMRASQELRRAFVLEAERVDAEEKQKELQKQREKRKKEQQDNEAFVKKSMEQDQVQPLEAGIGTHGLDRSMTNDQSTILEDRHENPSNDTTNSLKQDTTQSLKPESETKSESESENKQNNQKHQDNIKTQLQQNPFVQTEELDDDPLFPRSKQDFL